MLDTIDDDDVILPHVWATHARLQGSKVALVCEDMAVTWLDLNAAANRVANTLLSMGAGRGASVAVLMSNSIAMVEVMLGVIKAGACLVPLSTMLSPDQVGRLLADSGAKVLFACEDTKALAESCGSADDVRRIAADFAASGWQPLGELLEAANDDEPRVRQHSTDPFNII